jgi:hypothetical protein
MSMNLKPDGLVTSSMSIPSRIEYEQNQPLPKPRGAAAKAGFAGWRYVAAMLSPPVQILVLSVANPTFFLFTANFCVPGGASDFFDYASAMLSGGDAAATRPSDATLGGISSSVEADRLPPWRRR